MAWTDQIFRYCERGADPAFWAEPVNALTNAAFLIAGAAAAGLYRHQRQEQRGLVEALLIALVVIIGTGSFLFHTTATRWAAIADTAPIGIFMLAYFGYALRRFLALGWLPVALGIAGFVLTLELADEITCKPDFMPVSNAAGVPCFNGTGGYAPAFLAMTGIGAALWFTRHPAWRHLVAAGLVFLASMVFRTFDIETCASMRFGGVVLGTHFVWHVLNATVLYLLLRAAILSGAPRAGLTPAAVEPPACGRRNGL